MRISVFIAAMAAGVLSFSVSARATVATTIALEMDQDPTSLGWTVQKGEPGSHSISSGILNISTQGFYEFKASAAAWDTVVNNVDGWEMDLRMRIASSSSTVNMVLWINDNTVLNILEIRTNALVLNGGVSMPDIIAPFSIANTFHTYHLQAKGNRFVADVDGTRLIDHTRTAPALGTSGLLFGDGYYGHSSVSEWDYFRVTMPMITPFPEPACTGVLAAAGCIAICRRRRSLPKRPSFRGG